MKIPRIRSIEIGERPHTDRRNINTMDVVVGGPNFEVDTVTSIQLNFTNTRHSSVICTCGFLHPPCSWSEPPDMKTLLTDRSRWETRRRPPPLTHLTSSFWRDWAHVYEFTRATAPTTYLRDWFTITDIQSQTVWRPAYTSNIIALRITKFISVNAINSWRHFHVVLIIIIQEVYACVLVNTRNIYSIDVWNWIDPMNNRERKVKSMFGLNANNNNNNPIGKYGRF